VLRCIGWEAGFDYSRDAPPSHSECARAILEMLVDVLWALTCSLSLSFNFLALFISTVTSITGPAMALRGPEGSLGVALVHMEQQLARSLRFFGRALFMFALTLIGFGLQAIVALGFFKGVVILVVGGWTLWAMTYYCTDIGTKFHLAVGRAVRAEFSHQLGESTPGRGAVPGGVSEGRVEHGALDEAQREAARDAELGRAVREHRRRVESVWAPYCLWCTPPCGDGKSRSERLRASKRARPLWRLDEMAILPYHALQAMQAARGADTLAARPLPREQVVGLIGRLQGAGATATLDPADGMPAAADMLLFDRVASLMQQFSSPEDPIAIDTAAGAASPELGASWWTSVWPFRASGSAERPRGSSPLSRRHMQLTELGAPAAEGVV